MKIDYTKVMHEVEALEDRLQAVKWSLPVSAHEQTGARLTPQNSIVARTAGMLRGRVPSGIVYERRVRHEWKRRLHRLGL